jgi:hypothetical protein
VPGKDISSVLRGNRYALEKTPKNPCGRSILVGKKLVKWMSFVKVAG